MSVETQVAAVMGGLAAIATQGVKISIHPVMGNITTIKTEILPIVTDIYPVMTNLARVIPDPALGLGGNTEEKTGGEEDGKFRFHTFNFKFYRAILALVYKIPSKPFCLSQIRYTSVKWTGWYVIHLPTTS
jgi:hypothetical protein